MSKQLALSASLSVLMMAIYVLFGPHAASRPFETSAATSPVAIPATPPPLSTGL